MFANKKPNSFGKNKSLNILEILKQEFNQRFENQNYLILKENGEIENQELLKKRPKIGAMEKYRLYNQELSNKLDCTLDKNLFNNTIPIFINGQSIYDFAFSKKENLDPYSNFHLFSSFLLHRLSKYPYDFTKKFRFIYVQPIPWTQKTILLKDELNNEKLGLEDILRFEIEENINNQIIEKNKQGFGSLVKFDDLLPTIGNSYFKANLFSKKHFNQIFLQEYEKWKEEISLGLKEPIFDKSKQGFQKEEYLKIQLNKELMSLLFANIINSGFSYWFEELKKYDINKLQLYMPKTSFSAEIINNAFNYTKVPKAIEFIGGNQGPLGNSVDKIVKQGICHPSALNKLEGFLYSIFEKWNKNKKDYFRIPKKDLIFRKNELIKWDNESSKYGFFLTENKTNKQHPNIHDLVDALIQDPNNSINKKHLEIVRNFAKQRQLGFSRIEPRIVEFLKNNHPVYENFRSLTKKISNLKQELQYKKIIMPNDLLRFFDQKEILGFDKKLISDIRGSELSQNMNPHFNKQYIDYFERENKILTTGCSIEKLISSMEKESKEKIINQEIDLSATLRGIFIHEVSSSWLLEDLVHYKTLELAGIKSRSSKQYCETPFLRQIKTNPIFGDYEFSFSFHPDAYFFLEKQDKSRLKYDIVIMDTKTNRVTPYPKHKYLLQLFSYGWHISQLCEENLNLKMDNIYCVLNKNSFDNHFWNKEIKVMPHSNYRPQKYPPHTVFRRDNKLFDIYPLLLSQIMHEKENLKKDENYFISYKNKKANDEKICNKCYDDKKLICNKIYESCEKGMNFKDFVEENK